MNEMWSGVVTIATAIVGVAILAVLVSRNSSTSQVIQAATGGFATDLSAAVSPVTGQTVNTGGSLMGGNFLSGGANSINLM